MAQENVKQKPSRAQKEARIAAAQEREKRVREKQAAAERAKKIFTIIVCIILVFALGLPVMALSLFSGGSA